MALVVGAQDPWVAAAFGGSKHIYALVAAGLSNLRFRGSEHKMIEAGGKLYSEGF